MNSKHVPSILFEWPQHFCKCLEALPQKGSSSYLGQVRHPFLILSLEGSLLVTEPAQYPLLLALTREPLSVFEILPMLSIVFL